MWPVESRSGHAVTLAVITILVAVATGLAWLKLRRSAYLIAALALVLFFGIGCGPLAAVMASDLQAGYSAEVPVKKAAATAIVLLGGGTEWASNGRAQSVEVGPLAYGRLVKSLQLYRQCKQVNSVCFILITGGDPQRHGSTEAAVYGAVLRESGVDPADLVLEQRSLNTFQNAQYTAPLLQSRKVNQVLLVTSGVHLRRALLYFAHFAVAATPVRADHVSPTNSPVPLSYNFLIADLALHEYTGVARYYIYQLMGWNVQAKKAGAP
jgi:uncharacterized SAM-binding protein YcdF (DUF218 family)